MALVLRLIQLDVAQSLDNAAAAAAAASAVVSVATSGARSDL